MKKIIIFDLLTFILTLLFGILASTFQGLDFLTILFEAISAMSFLAFALGLICILFKIFKEA